MPPDTTPPSLDDARRGVEEALQALDPIADALNVREHGWINRIDDLLRLSTTPSDLARNAPAIRREVDDAAAKGGDIFKGTVTACRTLLSLVMPDQIRDAAINAEKNVRKEFDELMLAHDGQLGEGRIPWIIRTSAVRLWACAPEDRADCRQNFRSALAEYRKTANPLGQAWVDAMKITIAKEEELRAEA